MGNKIKMGLVSIVAWWVKLLTDILAFHMGISSRPSCSISDSSPYNGLGKAGKAGKAVPEAWASVTHLGNCRRRSCIGQASTVVNIWGVNQGMKGRKIDRSLSLSLPSTPPMSLSFKQINKSILKKWVKTKILMSHFWQKQTHSVMTSPQVLLLLSSSGFLWK